MEEWKEYKLGDVINVLDNKRIPLSSKERSTRKGNFPYYGAQGIIDYINDFIFNGTYLLIAEDGENLKSQKQDIAQLATGKFWVNNHAHIVESNGLCDIRYLCYLINRMDLSGYITGSAQPKLNQANLLSIIIRLPLLRKQQYIANFISMFDDKIELNRRINENLEQQAQALFKSWFVNFEPFKDGQFVDSELGKIPEGWRVGTIGDYCKIRSGFAFKSSWWTERGVKIVKIKNISSSGILNMDDCSYVSKENVSKAKEFSLKSGDILIAMTGATIGKFCLVPALKEEMYVNQRVGKFFLGENPIMKIPFIHGLLKCENIISQIINKGQGSAQPNISGNDIETIPIIYPPEDIILKYNELVSPYFSMIIENISACDFISQLRDTLLPRLMSGELEIKDKSYD